MKTFWLIAQAIFLIMSIVNLFLGHEYIVYYYTIMSFLMAILYKLDSKT